MASSGLSSAPSSPVERSGRLIAASMFLPVTCTLNTTVAEWAAAHAGGQAQPPASPTSQGAFAGSYSATMDRIRSAHSAFGAPWGSALARGASMGGLSSYARDFDVSGIGRDDDGGGYVFRPDQEDAPPGAHSRQFSGRRVRHRQTPSTASQSDWAAAMEGIGRRKNSNILEEEGDFGEQYSIDGNESTLLDDGDELSALDVPLDEEGPRDVSSKLWKFGARGGYSGGWTSDSTMS